MSLRKRVTPTVVTLSENDILKIAKTVKSFLIEDINNIVEEKQKPILNELSQLKIKWTESVEN
jgi:hypothetical protein